jgi:hypothetical protein
VIGVKRLARDVVLARRDFLVPDPEDGGATRFTVMRHDVAEYPARLQELIRRELLIAYRQDVVAREIGVQARAYFIGHRLREVQAAHLGARAVAGERLQFIVHDRPFPGNLCVSAWPPCSEASLRAFPSSLRLNGPVIEIGGRRSRDA